MEETKTISSELEEFRENYVTLFSLTDEKIDEVLKLIDYGRIFPNIWLEGQEEEIEKKILKICNIDQERAAGIFNVFVNLIRGLSEKGFISKRTSILKKLGFKQADLKKIRRIIRLLKKQKVAEEIIKVDSWREMSLEVLPHLSMVEYAYDVRCKMKGNKIEDYIPMVLMKLEVRKEDETPKELVFQIRLGDFKRFVRVLTEIYRNARALREYRVRSVRRKK